MSDGLYTVALEVMEWNTIIDQMAEGSVKRMLPLIQKVQQQIQEQAKENLNGTQPGTRRTEAAEAVGPADRN